MENLTQAELEQFLQESNNAHNDTVAELVLFKLLSEDLEAENIAANEKIEYLNRCIDLQIEQLKIRENVISQKEAEIKQLNRIIENKGIDTEVLDEMKKFYNTKINKLYARQDNEGETDTESNSDILRTTDRS